MVPADEVYADASPWPRKFAKGRRSRSGREGGDRRRHRHDLANGLRLESHLFASLFATEDRSIGMTSFLENGPGKAEFTGAPK